MKKTLGTQLWIAFKIWAIAVFSNTILGTACLTRFFTETYLVEIYMLYGLFFGVIASFPVFIILFFVIHRSVVKRDYGKTIFRNTLIAGIISATVAFFLFIYWSKFYEASFYLFACALFSGIAGITSQYKSLIRLEQRYELYEEYLFTD